MVTTSGIRSVLLSMALFELTKASIRFYYHQRLLGCIISLLSLRVGRGNILSVQIHSINRKIECTLTTPTKTIDYPKLTGLVSERPISIQRSHLRSYFYSSGDVVASMCHCRYHGLTRYAVLFLKQGLNSCLFRVACFAELPVWSVRRRLIACFGLPVSPSCLFGLSVDG